MGTYLVVDGNSLTYRAFFALPTDMATASGQVTNAVFGFTSMLINVLKDHTPDGVLVAFDRPEPTFRHEAEPHYKAHREAAPDILRQQMGLVREVLDAIGITAIDLSGWEADDIIATATDRLVDAGHDVIIVTGDRDSYQLVARPRTSRCSTTSGASATTPSTTRRASRSAPAWCRRCTCSTPRCAATTATTCPACPAWGRRPPPSSSTPTAASTASSSTSTSRRRSCASNLAEHEERARKNLELMLLRHDAPLVDLDLDQLGVTPNADEVKRLFDFLEFRTLADRLDEALSAMGTSVDLGPVEQRAEIVAEVTTAASPGDAAAVIASATRSTSPPRGSASRAAARSPGSRWWSTHRWPTCSGSPPTCSPTTRSRVALGAHANLRGHNVKPLMRSLLEFDVEVRGLAARHGDRRVPDRPGRGPLHVGRT